MLRKKSSEKSIRLARAFVVNGMLGIVEHVIRCVQTKAHGPIAAFHPAIIGRHKILKMWLHIIYVCIYCLSFANVEELSDNDKSKSQHHSYH